MSTEHHDDPRRRRRVVAWVVAGLALLVGVNALVLVAAGRDDDSAGVADTAPTQDATTGSAPDPARTVSGSGAGEIDGPHAAATAGGGTGPDGAPDHPDRAAVGPHAGVDSAEVVAGGASGDVVTRPHGAGLVLTSTVDGELRPGVRRTLAVDVRNGHPWPVHLLRTDIRATQPDGAPGCDPRWVAVERYRYTGDGDRVVIGARATTRVELHIELLDLPDVNQDACKGASFPLTLAATAAEWTG